MKLYREGKNEIRIHLTREDLKAYQISLEDFDYDSTRGKRVIWELFDRAREETGFDASEEKVYIQLYPMEKGGCELFVTKIEKEEEARECFAFSSFDCFFAAMARLSPSRDLSLYREKESDLFFALLPPEEVPPRFYEFGEKIKKPSQAYFGSKCRKIHWK